MAGQGAATTVAEAHHSERAGEEPILPARYIESGCGQCHQNALPGTPQLNLGRTMLARYGCVHCHAITRPDGTKVVATDHPPSLVHIADKTTREWIYQLAEGSPGLRGIDDDAQLQTQRCGRERHLSVSGEQQHAAGRRYCSLPARSLRRTADPSAGPSLYGESFCSSCHAVQNAAGNLVGGDVGPGTDAHWKQGKARVAGRMARQTRASTMRQHPCRITDLRRSRSLRWLRICRARSDSDYGSGVHLDAANAKQIAHGRKLIVELGCAACHEINGVQKPENFAPELSTIGSKPLAQIVFLPGMEHSLPSYIGAKIRQPRAFGASVKMPQFTLTASQTDALTTALLALTNRARSMPD